jgi:NAD(P)-dependent dehydrogenase (short-subunit alcohol dehydrogenase family)
VHQLAQVILERHLRLDAIINNAALAFDASMDAGTRVESRDGYELRFAVNYLAPFLLTRLLLPLLCKSAPSRIVNVASRGQAPLDFEDLMLNRGFDPVQSYRQSKLALIMFSFDLAEELRDSGVTVNAVHPAMYMATKGVPEDMHVAGALEQGLEATSRLVTDEALRHVTGRYFEGWNEANALGQAYDGEARATLRRMTATMLGDHLSTTA